MYKNIEKQTALELREQVDYQAGQIISRTLVQNELMSMTLFAFEKGEEISTHAAGGDAMVTVLEGTGRFTVGGEAHLLSAGESIVMPAGGPCRLWTGAVQDAPDGGLPGGINGKMSSGPGLPGPFFLFAEPFSGKTV